jgi:hypothetical protein
MYRYTNFKRIVSRDSEGVLMILMHIWEISVVPLDSLRFLKFRFPSSFSKISEFAVCHFKGLGEK